MTAACKIMSIPLSLPGDGEHNCEVTGVCYRCGCTENLSLFVVFGSHLDQDLIFSGRASTVRDVVVQAAFFL